MSFTQPVLESLATQSLLISCAFCGYVLQIPDSVFGNRNSGQLGRLQFNACFGGLGSLHRAMGPSL